MKATGVIVPLVTPLDAEGHLDAASLKRLVEHVVTGGVDAIFVAGSTGEFARLTDRDRHALFALTAEYARGRVPVYAGVSDAALGRVEEHLDQACKSGVDVAVASLPYYYTIKEEGEAQRWFDAVGEASRLPLLLYNIPSNVGAQVAPGVVSRLSGRVLGIKDSSDSPEQMDAYLQALGGNDRRAAFLCGSERLFPLAVQSGADGVVPAMANVFPRLWAQLWAARDDTSAFAPLVDTMMHVRELNAGYAGSLGQLVGKKRALHLLGIAGSEVSAPSLPRSDDQSSWLQAIDYVAKQLGETRP